MICGNCGFRLEPGAGYCSECGAPQRPEARRSRVRRSPGRHPAARFLLTDRKGDISIEVPWNRLIRVGRHPSTDLTLIHTSVSRFHAELVTTEDGCLVRDLDSSNGTFVNGVSIRELILRPGDELRFGGVPFTVEVAEPGREPDWVEPSVEHPVDPSRNPRLRHVNELVTALARRIETSAILDRLVEGALEATGADRASVALLSGEGTLHTGVYQARRGGPAGGRRIPRSIARHCLDERVAVITEAAGRDRRFAGDSIVALGVRSAMCAPILGNGGEPIGVCYLDHTTDREPFSPDDLAYLVALTGIAAATLERDG